MLWLPWVAVIVALVLEQIYRSRVAALSAAFRDNIFSDLVFELANPTINVYANEVLLVALGWKSYDNYLAEMKMLLI